MLSLCSPQICVGKRISIKVLILCFLLPLNLNIFSQATAPAEKEPRWRYQIPDTAVTATDSRTSSDKELEDKYFDSLIGAIDPLDGPQLFGRGSSGHAQFDEDFPAKFRDEVFVVHFSSWVSHLSASRHSVYTTINFQIDRVVSSNAGHVAEGSILPVLIPGGTVLAADTKRSISYGIRLDDFPLEPNMQYLIFLEYRPSVLPFFEYLKAWKVDHGVLVPASHIDVTRVAQGRSTHNGESLENAIRELSAR